ncbi:MAG: hypothetical protein JXR84_26170 [Anaerolineae bacterium]|nr:hypothetical protein [Anaerolineae bacterium]
MDTSKSLLTRLMETFDQWHAEQRMPATQTAATPARRALPWLLRQLTPNLGSVVLVLILLTTFPGLAAPNSAPLGTSLSTIPYQGRLADASGNPITDRQNMEFRLYDAPAGGTPLWEEFWTGGNSVNVSDGLFSVMLGSINTSLASVVQGNDQLYLGITVGTDTEMAPRVQLGSVPFAMISLTVPDGSVTSEKIATDAITTTHIMDGAVTQALAPSLVKSNMDHTLLQYGRVRATATETTNALAVHIDYQIAFPTQPHLILQPAYNRTPWVIATFGQPCDNTGCHVFLRRADGGSWAAGEYQDVDWVAIKRQ